jgi:rubrerythrin
MKINAVIVEDEKKSAELMLALLKKTLSGNFSTWNCRQCGHRG